jgi:hypothetical protein
VEPMWGVIAIFVILLVLGLATVAWMVRQWVPGVGGSRR